MFETILHIIWHAVKESVITLPILFVCYLLIELLEEKILNKYQKNKMLKSKIAPVVSAGFGLIPQCGFSVVASDLYSKRAITIGSLFAILLATSDEALPIMLSNPANYGSLALILGIKFVYAVVIGLSLDAIFNKKNKRKKIALAQKTNDEIKIQVDNQEEYVHDNYKNNKQHKLSKDLDVVNEKNNHGNLENSANENEEKYKHIEIHGCCKHNLEQKHSKIKELFIHPLTHSLKIFAWILLINIIFGFFVEFVGEDSISNFMSSTGFFEPFIVSIVGIIPNCAASVIITEMFLMGGISLGSCVAGLCVNSGIALIMLFKLNKNIKQNLAILFSLYGLSCLIGIVINLF